MPAVAPPPDDIVLPFEIDGTPVRGRLVRLGPAIDEILVRHPFDIPARTLIGEAATLVALMGAGLKFAGKLIFQVQGDGPVAVLVADYATDGAIRATATLRTRPDLTPASGTPDLRQLLGHGHIVMTIDQGAEMERYQGVTPLDGASLGEAAERYFDQSEQIPTMIQLAVGRAVDEAGVEAWRAGGIMVQFVPGEGGVRERGEASLTRDEDRETWTRIAALVGTVGADELLDPQLTPERLLFRLFHEEACRVFAPLPLRASCSCSAERIAAVLAQYDRDTLLDLVVDNAIEAGCDFCRTRYVFDLSEDQNSFTARVVSA